MHLMAGARELLRRRQPGRPGADHGHFLAGPLLGGLGGDPALLPGPVDDGAFDGLDGDGDVFQVQRAGRLAGRGTDAAGEFGEVVRRMQVQRGGAPVVAIDEVVEIRDLVVHRTAAMAVGNAAIHAARGLALHIALFQRDDEFAEMTHAIGRGRIGPVLPLDFQKAGDLPHRGLRRPKLRVSD
jgi:hypothetical protein